MPRLTLPALDAEDLVVRSHLAKLLLGLCALLALPAFAPVAQAAPGKSVVGGSLLYVQETAGGTIQRLPSGGGFRLRLTGVSPRVSTFTDRPRRRAASEPLGGFVGQWQKNGFAADPPNAALVLDRAPASRDVALLTLSHPHYDRGRETLTYRATPLRGRDDGALASFARRSDPIQPGDFGSASLFVDDGGGPAYTPVTLSVVDPSPEGSITFEATPSGGGRVAWSTDLPGRSGLEFNGGIPITSLVMSGGFMRLGPAGSTDGTPDFTLSLALEYEETQGIFLAVPGGFGTTITATVPTIFGPETQLLSPSPTLFTHLAP